MLFTLKRFDIFENVEICRKLTFEWLFDNLVNLDFWLFDNLLKFKFVTFDSSNVYTKHLLCKLVSAFCSSNILCFNDNEKKHKTNQMRNSEIYDICSDEKSV